MSHNLLSLDQSSKITGWGFFQDGILKDYGKFSFDDLNIDKRLIQIRDKIEELIQEHNINEVVYEDIQQQNNVTNNVQTFKILSEVYGVISELLERLQIPHTSLLATVWKKKLDIKGKNRSEQKKNAQLFIKEKYNLTVIQDIADAICIGEAYLIKDQGAW